MNAALLGLVGGAYAILAALAWALIARIGTRLDQLADQGRELSERLERGLGEVRLEIAGLREELHLHAADVHAHAR